MGSLKAVILAAGEGIRLRPFTMSRPKAMISVGNKPVLEYIVQSLVANGITDIVIVVGYCANTIMSHFGDGRNCGAHITYVTQPRPLGTANALCCAWPLLQEEERIIVLAGDNYIDRQTVAAALQGPVPLAVVTESDTPSRYGVVEVKDNCITSIVEKPQTQISKLISTGIYIFNKDILNLFREAAEVSAQGISEVLADHLPQLPLAAVKAKGAWIDAVYPQDLIRLNETALENTAACKAGIIEAGAVVKGRVQVGAGSRICAGCYLEGPIVIGENCELGPGVTIMPATSIGNDVQIGPYTCISDSVIMDNVVIGTHCHLARAALDCGVNMGSAILADGRSKEQSGTGVMIGQDSWIGSGTVFQPNTVVGAECRISSGAVVRSNLENRSIVV